LRSSIPFSNNERIVNILKTEHGIVPSIPGLEQLRIGFVGIAGMQIFIQNHLELLKGVLSAPAKKIVTACFIQEEYVPMLSEKGSNQLATEEELVILWNGYLEDVEGRYL